MLFHERGVLQSVRSEHLQVGFSEFWASQRMSFDHGHGQKILSTKRTLWDKRVAVVRAPEFVRVGQIVDPNQQSLELALIPHAKGVITAKKYFVDRQEEGVFHA